MEHEADSPAGDFIGHALHKRLQALTEEIAAIRAGQDRESVHRLRVASRRLRQTLTVFAPSLPHKRLAGWQKHLRQLTRALGEAREADVQLDWLEPVLASEPEIHARPGIARLHLRVLQHRQRLDFDLTAALDAWESSETTAEISHVRRHHGVRPLPDAARAVTERVDAMRALASCLDDVEQVDELHAMRIAAKRLRYTAELFAPLCDDQLEPALQDLRALQALLGDVHDCDVWLAWLPRFSTKELARTQRYFGHARPFGRLRPGLAYVAAQWQLHRDAQFRALTVFWQRSESRNVWGNLLEILDDLPKLIH